MNQVKTDNNAVFTKYSLVVSITIKNAQAIHYIKKGQLIQIDLMNLLKQFVKMLRIN